MTLLLMYMSHLGEMLLMLDMSHAGETLFRFLLLLSILKIEIYGNCDPKTDILLSNSKSLPDCGIKISMV
jgi:hypothetical protein